MQSKYRKKDNCLLNLLEKSPIDFMESKNIIMKSNIDLNIKSSITEVI